MWTGCIAIQVTQHYANVDSMPTCLIFLFLSISIHILCKAMMALTYGHFLAFDTSVNGQLYFFSIFFFMFGGLGTILLIHCFNSWPENFNLIFQCFLKWYYVWLLHNILTGLNFWPLETSQWIVPEHDNQRGMRTWDLSTNELHLHTCRQGRC